MEVETTVGKEPEGRTDEIRGEGRIEGAVDVQPGKRGGDVVDGREPVLEQETALGIQSGQAQGALTRATGERGHEAVGKGGEVFATGGPIGSGGWIAAESDDGSIGKQERVEWQAAGAEGGILGAVRPHAEDLRNEPGNGGVHGPIRRHEERGHGGNVGGRTEVGVEGGVRVSRRPTAGPGAGLPGRRSGRSHRQRGVCRRVVPGRHGRGRWGLGRGERWDRGCRAGSTPARRRQPTLRGGLPRAWTGCGEWCRSVALVGDRRRDTDSWRRKGDDGSEMNG